MLIRTSLFLSLILSAAPVLADDQAGQGLDVRLDHSDWAASLYGEGTNGSDQDFPRLQINKDNDSTADNSDYQSPEE